LDHHQGIQWLRSQNGYYYTQASIEQDLHFSEAGWYEHKVTAWDQPCTWHVSSNTVGEANNWLLLVSVPDGADAVQGALYTHPVVFMEWVLPNVTCNTTLRLVLWTCWHVRI